MPRIDEDLSGGLWTAPDSATLDKGQLSDLQNGIYLPGRNALQRARGRTVFGTASSVGVDVVGLRDIEFDNGDQYLVAIASTTALTAVVADSNNFVAATSLFATAASLEIAHYRNRFYLLNGVQKEATAIGSNLVAYLSATAASNPIQFRQHGMLAVGAAPSASATALAFSQGVTGYFEYWTTEVAKVTQDGAEISIESAFNSETGPTTVFVSSTGMSPIIQIPAVLNPITTHWRVYRSTKKDKASDKRFPTGFMIAEMATASASGANSMTDSSVTVTAGSGPSAFASAGFFFDFTNASGAFVAGGSSATATITLFGTKSQAWYGYNFGGFAGAVRGIEVEVGAICTNPPVPVTLTIGKRRADGGFVLAAGGPNQLPLLGKVASKSANVTSTGTIQVLRFGASADRWFAADQTGLVDSDFDANFMTRLQFSKPASTLSVDYIRASAYYAGSVDSTVVYPSIVYTFGDIVSQVSKNHPPPSSNTGDLFEDSLVVNDMDHPAHIRWSFPGDTEAFPPTYFIDFETRENDRVRLVKVVNSQLVVALDASIWRVNYLPSERDASFDRGKAIQPISKSYGCVNPMCACTFSMDGSTELLAFVSHSGIHITDGYSFDTQTDGLDWRGIISSTSTSVPICLINDRERQELVFYYQNDSFSTETYKALHLSYALRHLTAGPDRKVKLKVSGPVNMRNFDSGSTGRANLKSAWSVQRSTGVTDVYLGYGGATTATAAGAGKVYRETGTTIPAQDPRLAYVTRRMYQAGLANEWKINEMFGYVGSYDGAPEVSYTLLNTKTDGSGEVTGPSKSKVLGGQHLHKAGFQFLGEGIRVSAVITASAFSQESLVFDVDPWGDSDSGR